MAFIEKLTPIAEKLSFRLPAVPIIVEAKEGKFETVLAVIRNYLSENRVLKVLEELEIFPFLRPLPRFNYIATILPREWVFDLADALEVKKVYPNSLKFALETYPTVPPDGIYYCERGAFRETKTFTSTFWTKKLIGGDKANQKGFDGSGVRVAVLDTGVSLRHPATSHMISDSVMLQKHDENGHGTWVCACVGGKYSEDKIIARVTGKPVPTEGIAPKSLVISIKCLGYVIGTGSDDTILKAIEEAYYTHHADIINMSLGGKVEETKQENDPYFKVISELTAQGVIFCVAAGNEGPEEMTICTPGWLEPCLTVGAIDPINGRVAEYSSRGPTPDGRIKPDCVSYGGGLETPIHGPITGLLDRAGDNMIINNYSPIQGTSMATPHVAGLVACMRQAHSLLLGKTLTTDEIKQMLQELGEEKNNETGWGLLTWDMYENWLSTQYGIEL